MNTSEVSQQQVDTVQTPPPPQPSLIPDVPKPKTWHRLALFALGVAGLSIVVSAAIMARLPQETPIIETPAPSIASPIDEPVLPPLLEASFATTSALPARRLFTGQLQKIDKDLRLFKDLGYGDPEDSAKSTAYYSAGVFTQGELEGYTRIVALAPSPNNIVYFTLATKDFEKYYLDDSEDIASLYEENDPRSPHTYLDKSNIIGTKKFATEQPRSIRLDDNFSLYLEELQVVRTAETRTILQDQATLQQLASPLSNLSMYFRRYEQSTTATDKLSQSEKDELALRQKYLIGDTQVIVVDSTGLPLAYSMTNERNIQAYHNERKGQKLAWQKYESELAKYERRELDTFPEGPATPVFPSLGILGTQITSPNAEQFFSTYQTAFPHSCSSSHNTRVVDIENEELDQIGTIGSQPVFVLSDTTHPLYKLAYDIKVARSVSGDVWRYVNKDIPAPSFEEYVDQNPLLFIQNPWKQWVALGEYDFLLDGGCGKPVIYLYPTKPTQVSLKFNVPVQFTKQIPTYAGAWRVLAHPSGQLVNLNPTATDCKSIDTQAPGSEYALLACQTNTYPYLYWAGNVTSKDYPTLTEGWIVSRDELLDFLDQKLTEMGLNETEKTDFISYWHPHLLEMTAPYFRISFLQTAELNSLFTMTITPQPDTTFRIFMDYSPLAERPQEEPEPQVLDKLVRNGFTLVEWGGLK